MGSHGTEFVPWAFTTSAWAAVFAPLTGELRNQHGIKTRGN